MTTSDLTERVELEALALELGWCTYRWGVSINQARDKTAFGFNSHTITVTWSIYDCAIRAIITDVDCQETARRETYSWQSQSVGDWVALMLDAIVTARPAQGATA